MRIRYVLLWFMLLLLTQAGWAQSRMQDEYTGINFKHVGTGRPVHFKVISGNGFGVDTLGISVVLASGCAIIHEEYLLHNADSGNDVIGAEVPGRGFFRTAMLDSVTYGLPEQYRTALNGSLLSIRTDTGVTAQNFGRWTIALLPGYSKLNIHYLVNTHDAGLHKGHDVQYSYGFAYRFDFPALKSDVKLGMAVVVDPSIRLQNIEGMLPADGWQKKGYEYVYLPRSKPEDVVIRYGKTSIYHKDDDFSMGPVHDRSAWLYDQVDTLNVWSADTLRFHKVSKINFKPVPVTAYSVYGMVILAILGFGAIVFLLGPMIWGEIRKKK